MTSRSTAPAYAPRRPPRESFVTVRGLRHRLLGWGPVDAPPRVLLHGFMDCADTYQFLVDELPDDWHCIAPDWRGFGGTDHVGAPYWFADYLADLDVLLDVLSPSCAVRLIGHSMGGNIAAMYAGVRPERIRSVARRSCSGAIPVCRRRMPRSSPRPGPSPARMAVGSPVSTRGTGW
jgi:pimeloyl-ACP methyl ester carboxylesterase